MISLGLQIYSEPGPGGRMLADWTPFVEGLEFSQGPGGAWYASGFIPLPVEAAAHWYRMDQVYDVRLGPNIWNGRLTSIRLVAQGIEFTAKGYYRALRDGLYTAFWSLTGPGAWRALNQEDVTSADPGRYYIDFTNRIYIAANKDASLDSLHWGGVGYRRPHGSNTLVHRVTFDYELLGPSGALYRADLRRRFFDWTNIAPALWELNTTGSLQTGSVDVSIPTGAEALSFMLWRASVTPLIYTGETGEFYLKITNLRIYGRDGTEVRADHILGNVVSFVNGLNPKQLSSALHLIQNSAVDFENEVYEDKRPIEIADYLAGVGDDQGRLWEWGIDDNQVFYFRPQGDQAATYYVFVEDFALKADIEDYHNRAYVVYRASAGDNLRTATAQAESLDAFGVKLDAFTSVNTESLTLAQAYRDTLLADGDNREPVSSIEITAVYDDRGASVPLWMLRRGDVIALRNVPGNVQGEVTSARLTIDSVIISDGEGSNPPLAKVEPTDPQDALDFLIARAGSGL